MKKPSILRALRQPLGIPAAEFGKGARIQRLHQLTVAAGRLVDDLNHMHRYADRPRLIGNRARNRLPNPLGRICREFVSLCIIELIHRADQAGIALLDQVENVQPAAGILLCDRHHHQTGIGRTPFSSAAASP